MLLLLIFSLHILTFQIPSDAVFHSSDNDTYPYSSRESGSLALNDLVAAYLSDPECESHNVFVANPSGPGNISTTKLDFNALIDADCIAIERHNFFAQISVIPSISTHVRNYNAAISSNQPAQIKNARKQVIKGIKNWLSKGNIVKIPDICLNFAAKLRLRLENKRSTAASSSGSGNQFPGSKPCVDADPVDCQQKRYLCVERDYEASMAEICPVACNYCRVGETYTYNYAVYYGRMGCTDKFTRCNLALCHTYTEDYKEKYCAMTCQRCSSFLRWGYYDM